MKFLPVFLISALYGSLCFAQSKADSVKATEIISKSENAYAHLKTYVDSGKLIQTMITNGNASKTALIFKTAYANTGGFNFEYYKVGQSNSLYTINRTDSVVKTWWGIMNREERKKNISGALYAALGVSSNTSVIVPELLMQADFEGRNYYRQLKSYVFDGIEQVNGNDCYKIKCGAHGSAIVWIAKKDYLIRKIETEYTLDPAKIEAKSIRTAEELKKKDSVRYKNAIKVNNMLADISKRDSLRGAPREPFTVKDVYVFVPVADHKILSELLKYRPNREVAL